MTIRVFISMDVSDRQRQAISHNLGLAYKADLKDCKEFIEKLLISDLESIEQSLLEHEQDELHADH